MHEPVLVLNANFEPINVCTTRRAVGLLLAGKADLVVNGRGHIRTVKQLLPRPSVIRLEAQVHRPRPHVKLTRREEVGGQAVLGRQSLVSTPWLTERHGYDPTSGGERAGTHSDGKAVAPTSFCHSAGGAGS